MRLGLEIKLFILIFLLSWLDRNGWVNFRMFWVNFLILYVEVEES